MNKLQPSHKQLTGGLLIDVLSPPPSGSIPIHKIAHSLSKQDRFTGHLDIFYPVAAHAIMVSYMVPRELALMALCHDNAESIIGDVSSPMKYSMRRLTMGEECSFDRLDNLWQDSLTDRNQYDGNQLDIIKRADHMAGLIEMKMHFSQRDILLELPFEDGWHIFDYFNSEQIENNRSIDDLRMCHMFETEQNWKFWRHKFIERYNELTVP